MYIGAWVNLSNSSCSLTNLYNIWLLNKTQRPKRTREASSRICLQARRREGGSDKRAILELKSAPLKDCTD